MVLLRESFVVVPIERRALTKVRRQGVSLPMKASTGEGDCAQTKCLSQEP